MLAIISPHFALRRNNYLDVILINMEWNDQSNESLSIINQHSVGCHIEMKPLKLLAIMDM